MMALDLATMTSKDIGAAVGRRVLGRSHALNAIFLVDDMDTSVVEVANDKGRWSADALGFPALVRLDAIAPDVSSAAGIDLRGGAVCLLMAGAKDCTTRIPLPFDAGGLDAISYVNGDRLIVRASIRGDRSDKVAVAVVHLDTKTASQLEVPAIGDMGDVSSDGRFAWLEHSNGKLVLAFAPVDQLDAKKTTPLGPVTGDASAGCDFVGDRIVCVVYPVRALVSVSTGDGSIVTLEPKNAIKGRVVASDDGRWIAYARTGDSLEDPIKWFITPTDHAAPQPLKLDDNGSEVLAWLQ
jgi:hypothetical protein